MKPGARNQFEAVVTGIKRGGVMAQVTLDVPEPHTMSSVMTAESVDDLALVPGDKVKVVVKAISVLLVKE